MELLRLRLSFLRVTTSLFSTLGWIILLFREVIGKWRLAMLCFRFCYFVSSYLELTNKHGDHAHPF